MKKHSRSVAGGETKQGCKGEWPRLCVCVCVEVSTKAVSKAQLKGILKEFDREMKENVYSMCKGPETRITETGRSSS